MFTLTDTFNNNIISRHRSLVAAVRAKGKHARAIRRRNGQNSYVTYNITGPDGAAVDYYDLINAEETVRWERM
jgi:hypothetical protein